MEMQGALTFPAVDKTYSIEKGNQTFVFGTSKSHLYQSELLIPPYNASQPLQVIFDIGFDSRQVLTAKRNFTI